MPRLAVVALVAATAAVGVSACANQDPPKEEVKAESQQWRGPLTVVAEQALERTDITAEQRTAIETIQVAHEAGHAEREILREKFRAAASDIVRSGRADTEEFDNAVDEAMSTFEARAKATSDAVIEIHALLEPEQRAAMAVALRDHVEERYAQAAKRRAKRERFNKVATHLALTGVQLDELKQVTKELVKEKKSMKPAKDELLALIDAFAEEGFEEKVAAFHAEKFELMRQHVAKASAQADNVLSLLDDTQREVLADLIELGPEEAGLEQEQR